MPVNGFPIQSPGINVAVVRKLEGKWEFLILKRSGYSSYEGFWGFLSGTRNPNESVERLSLREIREEAGLVPESLWATEYLIQFYEPSAGAVWILPLLVACVPAESEVRLSAENTDFRWLTAAAAQKLVSWNNLVEAIANLSRELDNFPPPNWVQLGT